MMQRSLPVWSLERLSKFLHINKLTESLLIFAPGRVVKILARLIKYLAGWFTELGAWTLGGGRREDNPQPRLVTHRVHIIGIASLLSNYTQLQV